MEGCERGGDEGRVRKCCLSAATACLCLRSESHYNAEALVCAYERVCVCVCVCVCAYERVCVCVSNFVLHNNQDAQLGILYR